MSDNAYADMLIAKRANVWEQAKALLDTAAGEKRELDGTEQASYDKMTEDLRSIGEATAKLAADAKAHADSEAALRSLAETPATPGVITPAVDKTEDELRSFLKGERRTFEVKGSKADLAAISNRSLVKGTASAGGATVPTNFYNKLWMNLIQSANLINAGATVLQTTNGDALQLPATTARGTGALVAEAGTIPSSDPTFVQRSLGAYKYGVLIQVARELSDDTGVDLEGFLAVQAGVAVGNALGTDLVVGNGTNKPLGITSSTTLGVTGATGVVGAFNFDNLIDLYYSVIPQYRNQASAGWLFNDTSIGAARKLKDSQGRYLWEPSLTLGTPDTILTKPVYQDPNVATIAVGAKSVLFGDMAAYFVRMVNGIRFEQSLDFAFNQDLVTFRCLVRGDGILLDQTGAVKHFLGAAS